MQRAGYLKTHSTLRAALDDKTHRAINDGKLFSHDLAVGGGRKGYRWGWMRYHLEKLDAVVKPSSYEVILDGEFTCFYLDVDVIMEDGMDADAARAAWIRQIVHFGVADEQTARNLAENAIIAYQDALHVPLDEDFCVSTLEVRAEMVHKFTLCQFLLKRLKEFIDMAFDLDALEVEPIAPRVFSSCRRGKASFHILVPKLVFDSHVTLVAFTVWEFHQYVQKYLFARAVQGLQRMVVDRRRLLIVFKLLELNKAIRHHPGIVDLAPYARHQNFRLPFCGKAGGNPLLHVNINWDALTIVDGISRLADGALLILNRDAIMSDGAGVVWNFQAMRAPFGNDFDKLLVVPRDFRGVPIHVSPGDYPRPGALAKYFADFPREQEQRRPPCNLKESFVRAAASRHVQHARNVALRGAPPPIRFQIGSTAVDYTSVWILETGAAMEMRDLLIGAYIYHEPCEGTIGIPSARVALGQDGFTRAIYCFNCLKVTFELRTFRPMELAVNADEILVPRAGQRFINEDPAILDVDLRCDQ
ncbi:hypothetical protein HDU96_002086, partial [Phlyctochytrium bullatum]